MGYAMQKSSAESLTESIINQENDRTTWYTPDSCDTHPSIKSSKPLRLPHLLGGTQKRTLRSPYKSRSQFLFSLHGAFDRISREE